MTPRLLYTKANLLRKDLYQILISIYQENDNTISVFKKALTPPAQGHIQQILKNEKIWQKFIGKSGEVIMGKSINGQIRYKYLHSQTLDSQIITSLSNKQFSQATKLFSTGIDLINSLPVKKLVDYPAHQLDQYLRYFQLPPSLSQDFFQTANLDIATDNLIFNSGKVYYLDCEWIVDFPVERKLILYRYCLYSAIKYHHLLGGFKQEKLIEFAYAGLLFPTQWLDLAFPGDDIKHSLKQYFLKEENFQDLIHIFKHKTNYYQPNRLFLSIKNILK